MKRKRSRQLVRERSTTIPGYNILFYHYLEIDFALGEAYASLSTLVIVTDNDGIGLGHKILTTGNKLCI